MTFLNPLVLLGLAAAAIPVILHLLNRRRRRTVEFSSLRFLKELQHSSLRRLKLRQWLLLLLRTLLIAALVLSFARPVVHGNLAGIFGSRANTSMVFVVDDSPSMTVRTERGMVFDRAREAAGRLLQIAQEGDRVAVVPLSALAAGSPLPAFMEPSAARSSLRRLEPGRVARRFRESVPALRTLIHASRDANREVYIFTDAQSTQYAGPPAPGDSTGTFESDVRFFLVRPDPTSAINAGATAVRMESRFIARNHPARALVTLRNYSNNTIRQESVSLYLEGSRVAQQSVDLPPGETSVVPLSLVPKRTGILTGYAAIDDDALEADNTLWFVLNVPEAYDVVVTGPGAGEAPYPTVALTLGGDSLIAGRVIVHRVSREQLPTADLSQTSVLLLNGLDALAPAEGAAAVNFVRRGGSVLLFPGSGLDARSYNDCFWKPLGLPEMSPELPPGPSGGTSESFVSFSSVDRAHPLFAGMFDEQRKGRPASIESPKIRRSAGLRPGGKGVSIITLSNGEAFLAEYQVGSGKVLAFGVEPGTSWSDFPLKGIFAPLLHRAVAYCSAPAGEESTATVGASLRFALRGGGNESWQICSIVSPSGLEERVTPNIRTGSGTTEFVSSPTVETGVYTLREGTANASHILAARAVGLPSWEGDLNTMRDEDLPSFWSSLGLRPEAGEVLSTEGNLEKEVQKTRYGLELWRYFLAVAILCALGEMAVGHVRRSEEGSR